MSLRFKQTGGFEWRALSFPVSHLPLHVFSVKIVQRSKAVNGGAKVSVLSQDGTTCSPFISGENKLEVIMSVLSPGK